MQDITEASEALALAERQLADLEARIGELVESRDAVKAYVAMLHRSIGRGEAIGQSRDPAPANADSSRKPPAAREDKMRLYWEAVEIVRAEGRPMTAPEIHGMHPMRARFDANTLYRTLYNRVGTTLSVHSGAFWPAGEDLPPGWTAPAPRGRPPGKRRAVAPPASTSVRD